MIVVCLSLLHNPWKLWELEPASRRFHCIARGPRGVLGTSGNLEEGVSWPKVSPRIYSHGPRHIFLAPAAAAPADDDKSSIFGEFINHTLMAGRHNQDQRSRHNAFISDKFIFPAVICFDLVFSWSVAHRFAFVLPHFPNMETQNFVKNIIFKKCATF